MELDTWLNAMWYRIFSHFGEHGWIHWLITLRPILMKNRIYTWLNCLKCLHNPNQNIPSDIWKLLPLERELFFSPSNKVRYDLQILHTTHHTDTHSHRYTIQMQKVTQISSMEHVNYTHSWIFNIWHTNWVQNRRTECFSVK